MSLDGAGAILAPLLLSQADGMGVAHGDQGEARVWELGPRGPGCSGCRGCKAASHPEVGAFLWSGLEHTRDTGTCARRPSAGKAQVPPAAQELVIAPGHSSHSPPLCGPGGHRA